MAFFSPAFSSSISQPKMRQEGFHLPSPSPSNGNPPSPSSFDLFLPHSSSTHPHADSAGAGGGGGGSGSSLPTAFSRTGGGAMDFGDELAAIMSSSSGGGNSGNSGSPALSHERSTHAGTPPYDHQHQHQHHGHGANASNGYRPTHNIFDISAPPSAHYTSGAGGGYGPGAHAFSLPHTSHRPELPPISQPASLATSHLHGPHGLGAGHSPSPFDPHPHPALHHLTPHHLQHPHFLSSSGPSSGTPPLSGGAGGRDAFPAHFNSTIPPLGTGAHHQPQHEQALSESFHSYGGGGPFSPASASSGGGEGERETPSPGTPALNSAVPPQQQQQGGGGSRPPTGRMHSRHSQQRSPSRSRSRVRPGTASGVQGAAGNNANIANGGNPAGGAGPTRTTKGAAKRRDSFTAGPHQHHQFASASSSSAQETGDREGGLASPSITSLSASPPSQSQSHHRPSAITIPGGALLNNPNPNGPRVGPASPLGIGVGGMAGMSLNTPTGAQQGPPGGAPSSFSSLGSSLTPLTPIGLGPLGMGMNGPPPPLGMIHPGSPLGMSMGMGVGGTSGWFLPSTGSSAAHNNPNNHPHAQNEFGLPTPESYGQHYGQFGTPGGGSGGGAGSMGISPKETTLHGMGGAMSLGGMGNLGGAGPGPGPVPGTGGGGRGGKSESPPQDPVSKQAAIVSEKRRRRRESHNAVERRRRDNINEKITELATLIPEVMLDPSAPASGASANNASADDADGRAAGKEEKSAGTGDEDGTPAPDAGGKDKDKDKDKDGAGAGAGAVKANKGMILRKSVEYIRYLQQLVNAQAARNRDLETQLTRAGISPDPTTQGAAMPSLPGLSLSQSLSSVGGSAQSPAAAHAHALANGEELSAQGLGLGLGMGGGAQGDGQEQGMFGDDVLTLHTFGDDGSYLPVSGFGALEPMDEGAEMEMEMDGMDGMDRMDGLEGYGPGMDLAEDREHERSLSRPGGLLTNGNGGANGKHLRHLRSASHARGASASPGPSSALSDGDLESPEGSGEQGPANGHGSHEQENQSPNQTQSQRERERGERGRKDRFGRIGGDAGNRLVAVKEESASMEM